MGLTTMAEALIADPALEEAYNKVRKDEGTKYFVLAMLTKTNCALMLLVEILLKEFLNSVILKFNTVTSKSTTKTLMELTENDSFSSVGSDLTLKESSSKVDHLPTFLS